jgi:hypothetical protein
MLANGSGTVVAPDFANGDLEHHSYLTCYRLPAIASCVRDGMVLACKLRPVMPRHQATSPLHEVDRPGAPVHGLRRQVEATANSAMAAF